jgi:CRP-like cAMP-binding protein
MLGGDAWSFADAHVRVAATAERMGVDAFRQAVTDHAAFADLVGRFLHVLIGLLMQNAVCRVRHDARQLCARWLLSMHDRMHGQEFVLSHEALADMLGMHRPTVSAAASALQREGLIRYRYGRVTVLNADGLAAESCECYASVRALLNRLRQ